MTANLKRGLGAIAIGLAVSVIGLLVWRDVRSEIAPEQSSAPPAVEAAPPQLAIPVFADLDLLREVLAAEVAAREELAIEVETLRGELEQLRAARDEQREAAQGLRSRFSRGGRFDDERLREAGLADGRIDELRQAYEASQLDFLYLRDQAVREGWQGGGPGFAQLAQARAEQTAALQEELGLEMYDLMLFGAGQANRVVVRDVMPGSNAEAGGLLPGDVIRSYDDQPVFQTRELRYLMRQSDPETPVDIQVERDGLPATVRLTPGPMGVTLRPARRQPDLP
ncbi:MAG: PDZ domain-containing protein [Myxococcota bacterium]